MLSTLFGADTRTILVADGDNLYYFMQNYQGVTLKEIIDGLLPHRTRIKPTVFYTLFDSRKPGFNPFYDEVRSTFPGADLKDKSIHFNLSRNKSYADMEMVVYILERLDEFDNLILMTNDQDFGPLVLYLQEIGKRVHVVCTDSVNRNLFGLGNYTTDLKEYVEKNDISLYDRVARTIDICFKEWQPNGLLRFFSSKAEQAEYQNNLQKRKKIIARRKKYSNTTNRVLILADCGSLFKYFASHQKTVLEKMTKKKSPGKAIDYVAFYPKSTIYNDYSIGWGQSPLVGQLEQKLKDDFYNGLNVYELKRLKNQHAIDMAIYLMQRINDFDTLEILTDDKSFVSFFYFLEELGKKVVVRQKTIKDSMDDDMTVYTLK
jgi:uncharacterized LabA/DUF88 family protein